MNPAERVVRGVDTFQQHHRVPGFVFGVVKKFGDDRAGSLAALIAYFWLKDRLSAARIAGLLIGLGGVVILVWDRASFGGGASRKIATARFCVGSKPS